MSLQTIEINSVKITFDKEKTKEYRTDFNMPCDCQDCRNYYKHIENNAELVGFLSGFGIDYLRPEEVFYFDLRNSKDSLIKYITYYSVFGHINKEISIKKEDCSVSFEISGNVNVGHEITDDYFFIVIDIDLPYILDEERELPISFSQKIEKFSIVKVIKSIFKRN